MRRLPAALLAAFGLAMLISAAAAQSPTPAAPPPPATPAPPEMQSPAVHKPPQVDPGMTIKPRSDAKMPTPVIRPQDRLNSNQTNGDGTKVVPK